MLLYLFLQLQSCELPMGEVSAGVLEALTFTTLFPNGTGGLKNTPAGCTHRHYIHKTLGSVATHFARAQEVATILGAHYPCAS